MSWWHLVALLWLGGAAAGTEQCPGRAGLGSLLLQGCSDAELQIDFTSRRAEAAELRGNGATCGHQAQEPQPRECHPHTLLSSVTSSGLGSLSAQKQRESNAVERGQQGKVRLCLTADTRAATDTKRGWSCFSVF